LPLIDQPGATLHYGHSTDLLGLLIARIEDAPLGDVLERRIFGPLGMCDTGFTVAREKADRCARLYGFDQAGRLTARLTAPGGSTMAERPERMAYASGGQGLWSTLDDYLAFARMFLDAGAVGDLRLLRPATLKLMTSNCLTEVSARPPKSGCRCSRRDTVWDGRRGGDGAAEGIADHLRRRCRHGRLAGRLRWLVAGRS
jgi:CubicO group peptidase (beta-lactamase class C family)